MGARRKFTREFKIQILRELENGKPAAEVCREHLVHPSLLTKWRQEYRDNPGKAFSGCGNTYKSEAKVAEYERLVGQLCAENAFLKKVLTLLEARFAEYRRPNGVMQCTQSSSQNRDKTA